MREIKFRGKDIQTGEWVVGDLHTLCDRPHIHTAPSSFPYAGKRSFIDPDTVGQFTGLRDKNGKDIYEGDILKRGDVTHVVEYREAEAAFVGRFFPLSFVKKETEEQPLYTRLNQLWLNMHEKEVIGNIHDNPELIK